MLVKRWVSRIEGEHVVRVLSLVAVVLSTLFVVGAIPAVSGRLQAFLPGGMNPVLGRFALVAGLLSGLILAAKPELGLYLIVA